MEFIDLLFELDFDIIFCFESYSHSKSSLFDVIPKAFPSLIFNDLRISKLLLTSKRGPKASEGFSDISVLK